MTKKFACCPCNSAHISKRFVLIVLLYVQKKQKNNKSVSYIWLSNKKVDGYQNE